MKSALIHFVIKAIDLLNCSHYWCFSL